MKQFSVSEVLRRRGKSHGEPTNILSQTVASKNSALERQLKEVDDQVIDGLIGAAVRGEPLTSDQKFDLCLVIAQKGGHIFNKQVVGPQLILIYCPGVTELSNDWNRCRQNFFVLSGQVKLYQLAELANGPKFNTQPSLRKTSRQMFFEEDEEERNKYTDMEAFTKCNRQYELVQEYGQYRCVGQIFKQQGSDNAKADQLFRRKKLIAVDAVIAIIPHLDRESETVFSDGMSA